MKDVIWTGIGIKELKDLIWTGVVQEELKDLICIQWMSIKKERKVGRRIKDAQSGDISTNTPHSLPICHGKVRFAMMHWTKVGG